MSVGVGVQPPELRRWRDRYTAAGLPAIPLRQGSKAPCGPWQRPPGDQWTEVGAGFCGNLGIVLGGPEAVCALDCDDSAAIEAVLGHFEGLGASLPTVCTPSGGRHVYLKAPGVPEGFTRALLAPGVGKGDLRARDCYVVAPASDYNGRRYRFVVGGPEAIGRLCPIAWRDVAWLVRATPTRSALRLAAPPVPLVRREMSAKAERLLMIAGVASPGKPMCGYDSRSEAEAAVCTMLILAGWTLGKIKDAFQRYQPGHYREHTRPAWYLEHTYRATLNILAATPTRLELAAEYEAARATPWAGPSGLLDQAVYCGLLSIGWQWATWEPYASVRDLEELATASSCGVRNSLKRLQAAGLIHKSERWSVTPKHSHKAARWVIRAHKSQWFVGMSVRSVGEALGQECVGSAEVWAPARLGRSAGAVWAWLGADPATVMGLAEATGKTRKTVRSALRRLEVFELAEQVPGGWVRGETALGDVACELRAPEAAARRRTAHALQREAWRRWTETRPRTGSKLP